MKTFDRSYSCLDKEAGTPYKHVLPFKLISPWYSLIMGIPYKHDLKLQLHIALAITMKWMVNPSQVLLAFYFLYIDWYMLVGTWHLALGMGVHQSKTSTAHSFLGLLWRIDHITWTSSYPHAITSPCKSVIAGFCPATTTTRTTI